MRAFVFACVAAAIIAAIGGIVLNNVPDNAASAFSTSYVRLGA